MQKIILDTNVLVSSLIQRGFPFLIVNDLFLGNKIQLCISEPLLNEYYLVLNRGRFLKYPDFVFRAEALLADVEKKSTMFYPKMTVRVIKDLPDNRLLELAAESEADFLVTGNTNDFTMTEFGKTAVVSPRAYFESFAL